MWLLILLLTPLWGHAYLDPGTGSFIVHVIVGGVVGASYAVRVFWRHIKIAPSLVMAKLSGRKPQSEPVKQENEL